MDKFPGLAPRLAVAGGLCLALVACAIPEPPRQQANVSPAYNWPVYRPAPMGSAVIPPGYAYLPGYADPTLESGAPAPIYGIAPAGPSAVIVPPPLAPPPAGPVVLVPQGYIPARPPGREHGGEGEHGPHGDHPHPGDAPHADGDHHADEH